MTWTYDAGQITTSSLMQCRFLIGDTQSALQQLQDEEINWTLTRYSNVYSACAEMCRALATKYASQVDLVQGELRTNYSARSRRYDALARDMEMRGLRGVVPYAGGISESDKANVQGDSDRVTPDFNKGQFDDLLPVGPAGQQTTSPPPPDSDTLP